jgi:hypothetical protein
VIVLGDDGTMDTVLCCTKCGAELRYNFEGTPVEEPAEDLAYDEFVAWAIDDATSEHTCDETEEG